VFLLTELIGLHLATIFYLAFNIRVLGKMSWVKVILLSVLIPSSMYIIFDKVFLIPLPLGLWGGSLIPF
jgi:putative tricarboxylic transport membrane protein